jgi:hypothetical protein
MPEKVARLNYWKTEKTPLPVGGRDWWLMMGEGVGLLIRVWWAAIHQERADSAAGPPAQ